MHKPASLLPVAAMVVALTGCYSQNPLRKDPEVGTLSLGQFTIKTAQFESASHRPEKIAETSTSDESSSFRHWQAYFFAKCASCDTDKSNAVNFLNNYGEYCRARGGQWSIGGVRPSGTCTGPRPFDVRISVYSIPDPIVNPSRWYFLLVDAFERKDGTTRAIEDEYRAEPATRTNNAYSILGTSSTIPLRFNAYVKRDLPAEAVARESERLQRATDAIDRKNEQAMRQAVAEATYLPQTKTVGQQICHFYNGQQQYQTRSGYIYATIDQPIRVSGYTEKVSGNRIQIRIGSIEIFDPASGQRRNIDRLGGSPELKVDSLIWDDAIDWRPC